MKRFFHTLICITVLGIAVATGKERIPRTDKPFNDAPEQFTFAIVSDNTGGMRPGVMELAVEKLNVLQPEFVISVGDLVEGYTEDGEELASMRDALDATVDRLDMPFYYVGGNHDMSNDVMRAEWEKRYGSRYYHFVYKNILFMAACTEDGEASHISEKQIAYFNKALAKNKNVAWTLVFFHKPLWEENDQDARGWTAFEALFAGRKHTMFAGHYHSYKRIERKGAEYFRLATTGGISKLRPENDEFDHVMMVTMKPDGPVVANVMLDGVYGREVRDGRMWHAFQQAAYKGELLAFDPLLNEEQAFTEKPVFLKATNPVAETASVKISFAKHPELSFEPAELTVTLPPHGTRADTVMMRSASGTPVAAQTAIGLDAVFTCMLPGDGPKSVSRHHDLYVLQPLDCPPVKGAVTVDGNLDEWPELPHGCTAAGEYISQPQYITDEKDASLQFGVAYDDANVYLALKVLDDDVMTDSVGAPWQMDGVQLLVDARPEPTRSLNRGWPPFGLIINPGRSLDEAMKKLPAGSKIVCVRTDDGYAVEIGIPASFLDNEQGGPWKALRVGIGVFEHDRDGKGGRTVSQLWWTGNWSYETKPGSGTFVKR